MNNDKSINLSTFHKQKNIEKLMNKFKNLVVIRTLSAYEH